MPGLGNKSSLKQTVLSLHFVCCLLLYLIDNPKSDNDLLIMNEKIQNSSEMKNFWYIQQKS